MNTPRYQHIRFYKLDISEDFFHGKMRYYKAGFFNGRTILDGELVVIMPWTKVRSARPFGKPAGVSVHLCKSSVARPPQAVTPGGDRTPEAIGGNELTPSA